MAKFSGRVFFSFLPTIILVNSLIISPALAGRYVLNQTPNTIIKYWGKPLSMTVKDNTLIYTYSPPKFKQLFSQYSKANFSVEFVNQKAKEITLKFNGDFWEYPEYNFVQSTAAKFFQYIFGYEPPEWRELSSKFTGNETIYDHQYCLGDGVAVSFITYGYKQVTDDATFYYNPACEPQKN